MIEVTPKVSRALWQYGLLSACLAILVLFLVYPILLTVRGGFASDPARGSGFTLEHVLRVFKDPETRTWLFNSLTLATSTTILATVIALPLAVLAARYRFPGKSIFQAAILVPMILPPFVGAIGLRMIVGREGALNALLDSVHLSGVIESLLGQRLDLLAQAKGLGVVLVQSLSLYPIIFLNASASLANIDPAMDEAAENLGAGFFRRFFTITLPLMRPGLFAGGTIVFIWSFTELGTPLMFDYYRVIPVQIFNKLKEVESSAQPYALTVVMLGCAILLYSLGKLVFGRAGYAMQTRAARAASEERLEGTKGLLAAGVFVAVFALAILPHVGVILTSLARPGQWHKSIVPTAFTLSHYREALASGDSFGAIVNSLKLSLLAMVLDTAIGIVVAYLLVRTKVIGRGLLDALCMLPLAVPGLVMAFGYVAMSLRWPFGQDGPLSGFAIFASDPNPFFFLIIAYGVRRLPYMVRSTVAGLEQTSGELEEAAINLGATRTLAVRKVIIPLILANLIAGGLLVFSFSMLEVSDSLLLAQQTEDYPITKAIWALTDRLGDGPHIASALGVWGMALLTITLFAASAALGKKMGSIFRV
ncbi:MAG: iron ABC transporter permease [Phycisphaerales bacterium]|nr:MAG: iron ABC transporter permease [Phycisphaerales bacterium]